MKRVLILARLSVLKTGSTLKSNFNSRNFFSKSFNDVIEGNTKVI